MSDPAPGATHSTRRAGRHPHGEQLAPAVTLTVRGMGFLVVFVALVLVAVATDSRGPVPLLVGLGAALLAAPLVAWFRGWRSLTDPPPRILVRPAPPVLAVGALGALDVAVLTAYGRRLPPLRMEQPASAWRVERDASGDPHAVRSALRRIPTRLLHAVAPPPSRLLALRTPGADAAAGLVPSVRVPVPTGARGMLRVPPLRVWVHDPLGLFAVPVALTDAVTVVIHPAPAWVHGLAWAEGTVREGWSAAAAALRVGAPEGTGEFNDLRPYVPGDRLHRLDWQALARRDQYLVRRFDPEGGAGVHVVVDDRAGVHIPEDFEVLLASALAIAQQALDDGRPLDLSTLTGRSMAHAPGTATQAALLAFLAALEPRRLADGDTARDGPTPPTAASLAHATLVTTHTGFRRLPAHWRGISHTVVVP